jgi:hypothetical protein
MATKRELCMLCNLYVPVPCGDYVAAARCQTWRTHEKKKRRASRMADVEGA